MRRPLAALLLLLAVVGPAAPAAAARPLPAAPAAVWPGMLEVELADGTPHDPAVAALDAVAGVEKVLPAFPTSGDPALSRWLTVEVTDGTEATVAAVLDRLPQVASAARVPVRVPAYDPNDPRRAEQWHLDRIGARGGWSVERGNRGARVGVIDTQFDAGHPELAGVLFRRDGKPGVERFEPGCPRDARYSEHGTFVAGIAAAGTDNRAGVSSVGFSIGVVAVQAGVPEAGACLISPRWSRALVELADAGVRVVNLSFSGTRASATEAAAVRYAVSRGTLVVAAAGNDGSTAPAYPAALPFVVGVAATDQGDRLWSGSNRGSWVDVAAPGVGLLTVCPGGYCNVTGTSAAAPVVSAIATLVAADQPHLEGLQLRGRVLSAAAPITGVTFDPAVGRGRVRLDRAVSQRSVRLNGPDRVGTAQAVGHEAHPGGRGPAVDRVVLVPADTPGDRGWVVTLPAAGLLHGGSTAMVLTGRDRLHPAAAEELDRFLPDGGQVILPGSAAVGISAAVEDQLRARGHDVVRVAGADDAATAAALADEILGRSHATAALVARGDTFADALPLAAAAAARGLPLVYVGQDSVPDATCDWIRTQRTVGTLHLAGGTKAIAPAVEDALRTCAAGLLVGRDLTITRDAGASRVETSVAIARRHFGSSPTAVSLANGFKWPDAVTGGALAATRGAPVLLTTGTGAVEPGVRAYLAGTGTTAYVLGGPAVVSDTTRQSLEASTR